MRVILDVHGLCVGLSNGNASRCRIVARMLGEDGTKKMTCHLADPVRPPLLSSGILPTTVLEPLLHGKGEEARRFRYFEPSDFGVNHDDPAS